MSRGTDPRFDPEAQPRARRALSMPILIGACAVLYAAFVVLCFQMEAAARSRFRVPSQADIAAIEDRAGRVRAEGARNRALDEMRAWPLYAAYDTTVSALVVAGVLVPTAFGGLVAWRNVRRDSLLRAKWSINAIVIGALLCGLLGLALVGWPPLVAVKRLEATPTTYLSGAPSG